MFRNHYSLVLYHQQWNTILPDLTFCGIAHYKPYSRVTGLIKWVLAKLASLPTGRLFKILLDPVMRHILLIYDNFYGIKTLINSTFQAHLQFLNRNIPWNTFIAAL